MVREHHKKHINHALAVVLVFIMLFATAGIVIVKIRTTITHVSAEGGIL